MAGCTVAVSRSPSLPPIPPDDHSFRGATVRSHRARVVVRVVSEADSPVPRQALEQSVSFAKSPPGAR